MLFCWHFEGRCFQVCVFWFYMLLACGIFWIWDGFVFWILDFGFSSADLQPEQVDQSKIQNPKSKIPLLVLPIAAIGFLWPSLSAISDQVASDTTPTGFVTDMKWLKDHSGPQ